MKLGVSYKLTATLMVACALPLAMGFAGMLHVGYRSYLSARGELAQARATSIAQMIGNVVSEQIADLHAWTWMSEVNDLVTAQDAAGESIRQTDFMAQVEDLDRRWPALDPDSPEVSGLLTNRTAQFIKLYKGSHPLFVEIFVTDRKGRLIAASNKTTDYWQADETWWKKAFRMRRSQVWVEGIHFDESALAYSLDVAIPIFREPDDLVVGVVKAVIDTSPLFASLPAQAGTEGFSHDVLSSDGQIVAHLFGEKEQPFSRSVRPQVTSAIAEGQGGWCVAPVTGSQAEMVGFAPLRLYGQPAGALLILGAYPLYVMVHTEMGKAMAPVYFAVAMFGIAGLALLVVLFLIGIYIAHRHIVEPLETLRGAVHSFSDSAVIEKTTSTADCGGDPGEGAAAMEEVARRIDTIRTGDEIERLARDFRQMADRVAAFLASCTRARK